MVKANLLITYDPTRGGKAKQEVESALTAIKEKADFLKSKVDGIFLMKVKDAKATVKKLTTVCKKSPDKFEATFHYIPIEKWCKSTIADMQKTIKGFVKDIKQTEKWKMDLGKRAWNKLPTTDLILKLTDVIDRPKVDLSKPQKIVKVEIIGTEAAISLLTPDELLNVPKLK